MNPAAVIRKIRGPLPQEELAQRSGISRVTIARWETGVVVPKLDDVMKLARAAGKRLNLEVRTVVTTRELKKVDDSLERGPTERLQRAAGECWPSLRAALRLAVAAVDETVVVGPVAAALRGAPVTIGDQVDLLTPPGEVDLVARRMKELVGAIEGGTEHAPGADFIRRVVHSEAGSAITITDVAPGIADIPELIDRSNPPAMLNAEDVGILRFALVEDLVDYFAGSPWPEHHGFSASLEAVLASGRYSTRDKDIRDAG